MSLQSGPESISSLNPTGGEQYPAPALIRSYDLVDGIQATTITPGEGVANSLTVMVGGVVRDEQARHNLPAMPAFFGHLATKLATADEPSAGLFFHWPGQGNSAGNALHTSIASRTELLVTMVRNAQERYATDKVNLVGVCMGAYSVLHSLEYFADDEIQNTVLLSPPAFPASVHRLTYADGTFGQTVRSDWDADTSPAWPLVAAISNRTLMTYFEYDDPPIPPAVRERHELEGERNPHVTVEQIDGVGHNFRDPLAPYANAKIDKATMVATSARVARFLQTPATR